VLAVNVCVCVAERNREVWCKRFCCYATRARPKPQNKAPLVLNAQQQKRQITKTTRRRRPRALLAHSARPPRSSTARAGSALCWQPSLHNHPHTPQIRAPCLSLLVERSSAAAQQLHLHPAHGRYATHPVTLARPTSEHTSSQACARGCTAWRTARRGVQHRSAASPRRGTLLALLAERGTVPCLTTAWRVVDAARGGATLSLAHKATRAHTWHTLHTWCVSHECGMCKLCVCKFVKAYATFACSTPHKARVVPCRSHWVAARNLCSQVNGAIATRQPTNGDVAHPSVLLRCGDSASSTLEHSNTQP
jgi:hypothetical protein